MLEIHLDTLHVYSSLLKPTPLIMVYYHMPRLPQLQLQLIPYFYHISQRSKNNYVKINSNSVPKLLILGHITFCWSNTVLSSSFFTDQTAYKPEEQRTSSSVHQCSRYVQILMTTWLVHKSG